MSASPAVLPPLRPPAWANALVLRSGSEAGGIAAAFAAGAALGALDGLIRAEAPFAGVWRQRLALKAAVACLEGRAGDEAGLRDALAFTRPGGDPGPAGRLGAAWVKLAGAKPPRLDEIAAGLGGAPADLGAISAVIETHARSSVPAPLAAAAAAAAVASALPRAAPFALAVADLVLARRLGWRAPVPLLTLEIGRARPKDANWSAACCAAYARAAARACDLHAELGRAAERLAAVAPKLRAKGAAGALAALREQDAVSGAAAIAGLSERGLRRLFDRLVELGAVRELTGRPTFRLYGL